MGFAFNLIFLTAQDEDLTLGLILGAPAVPALLLLASLWFCPESPRYVSMTVSLPPSFLVRLEDTPRVFPARVSQEWTAIDTQPTVHEEENRSLQSPESVRDSTQVTHNRGNMVAVVSYLVSFLLFPFS